MPTLRCSKRSLFYCKNRTEHRHCVCGQPEGHDHPDFPNDGHARINGVSVDVHKCAWCGGAYEWAQTSEGGA